jgi:TolA-binding protein
MRVLIGLGISLALTASASAQQPQMNPLEQALSNKLTAEINSGLQCNVAAVNAAKQIADMQKQIDDLKAKYEAPQK